MSENKNPVPAETDIRSPAVTQRTEALFHKHQNRVHRRSDRMFARLMVFQWVAGIAAAVWISPLSWSGAQSSIHWHVWAAVFIGGAITSLPVFLARYHSGQVRTRHVIAIGQMLTSALLIHLTGGRIETHFHVFGSLAFLAFYRDWRVILSATVVVAADHFLRGTFWPQSVFGVLASSHWRWVEHAGWVVFEDVFLLISIRQSLRETRLLAARQARLEAVNQGIELLVRKRTAELEQTHKDLVETSRQAGKAEVATSVLHNVGNVLNSINISASMIAEQVRNSKAASVAKLAALVRENAADLGTFMTTHPKGLQVPAFLDQLTLKLGQERDKVLNEISSLTKDVDHVKDIISMQQSYARVTGASELVRVPDLIEDALRMNESSLARHKVQHRREFEPDIPAIDVEKHKVLQILVNLIRNASQACTAADAEDKQVTLRIMNGGDRVRIAISDNGVGIPPENLNRIFNHGFTTKRDGHGFGLHNAAIVAKELGGALRVESEGPGKGATFILELPCLSKKKQTGVLAVRV